jgi:hypothetical protein
VNAGALSLGASGTLGSVIMGNATTGTVTLEPVAGPLGSATDYMPAGGTLLAGFSNTSGDVITGTGTTAAPLQDSGTLLSSLATAGGNSNITSLSGLTTALTVAQGGSGAGTFTIHGVLLGQTTGAFHATVALTAGQMLLGQTAADPAPESMSQDCTITNAGVITCLKTNNVSFGTAATVNTGTSGGTLCLLNAACTFSGITTFSAPVNTSSSAPTSGATITPNFNASNDFAVTLINADCPCTIANPSGSLVAMRGGVIAITESSTGGDTVTWGTNYRAVGGSSTFQPNPTASAITYFAYKTDPTGTYVDLIGSAANPTH